MSDQHKPSSITDISLVEIKNRMIDVRDLYGIEASESYLKISPAIANITVNDKWRKCTDPHNIDVFRELMKLAWEAWIRAGLR